MSTSPQYASNVKAGHARITTGDSSRTAPTVFSTSFVAGPNGSRIDRITATAVGNTSSAMLRHFLVEGCPGVAIASITYSGTTATVTTAASHGLSTGNTISVRGAFPDTYNASGVAITVTNATTFTYTMPGTPTVTATVTTAYYATTPSSATVRLWQEVSILATTVSDTVPPWAHQQASASHPHVLPVFLPPGWSIRSTCSASQPGIDVLLLGGDF